MILIGMFDSPFVRRAAVSMKLLGLPFEHRSWSVGADFDRIRAYNPLGRVPTLVLGDGEVLLESAAILDFLDDSVGASRALLPHTGPARRDCLRLMAIACGVAEKAVMQVYERVFRAPGTRDSNWVARCRLQVEGGLDELERAIGLRHGHWLTGESMTQADITLACVFTFVTEALAMNEASIKYPALARRTAYCETLSAFKETRVAFAAPSG